MKKISFILTGIFMILFSLPAMAQDDASAIIEVPGIDLKSVFRRLESSGFDPGPYSEDELTQFSESLRRFQKFAKLKESGVLDSATWAKLQILYDPLESKTAVSEAPKKERTDQDLAPQTAGVASSKSASNNASETPPLYELYMTAQKFCDDISKLRIKSMKSMRQARSLRMMSTEPATAVYEKGVVELNQFVEKAKNEFKSLLEKKDFEIPFEQKGRKDKYLVKKVGIQRIGYDGQKFKAHILVTIEAKEKLINIERDEWFFVDSHNKILKFADAFSANLSREAIDIGESAYLHLPSLSLASGNVAKYQKIIIPEPYTVTQLETELFEAVKKGDGQRVKELLEKGAKAEVKNKRKETPLCLAVRTNKNEIAQLLIAKGAEINAECEYIGRGETLLHSAASRGSKEIAEQLILKGVDVNATDEKGSTPLHEAATRELAELLLKKGANPNTRDSEGYMPLHSAVKKSRREVADLLIKNGADVNAEGWVYPAPLHMAAGMGDGAIAYMLIKGGAAINAKDKNNTSPLYYAATRRQMQMMKLLISKGADINGADIYPDVRRKKLTEWLLSKGLDVNATDRDGRTMLHRITGHSLKKKNFEYLVSLGADVNAKDRYGTTSLHLLVLRQASCKNLAEILISEGADVNAKDNDGIAPLHLAWLKFNTPVAELLVEKGADDEVRIEGERVLKARYSNFLAHRDIEKVWDSAKSFFRENPTGILTLDVLRKEGYQPAKSVMIAIESGARENLWIKASHINGDEIYSMNHKWKITSESKQE